MQFFGAAPYAKRAVPTPGSIGVAKWADAISAWLGVELANVQRGSGRASHRTVTSATTALVTDGIILANATAGGFTVTLPDPLTVPDLVLVIKKVDSSGNAVTLGGTVDGAVNPTLATQYKAKMVWAAGAWYTVASV